MSSDVAPARDLEDLVPVRVFVGLALVLLAVDSCLVFCQQHPGGVMSGLFFLAAPAAVVAARALPQALARHPLTGLTLPALLGGCAALGACLLWIEGGPPAMHAVEGWPSMAVNTLDDLHLILERRPTAGAVALCGLLAVPGTLPLLAVRLQGLGLRWQLGAGFAGGLLTMAPLAAAQFAFPPGTILLLLLGGVIGLQAAGGAYLLARPPCAGPAAGRLPFLRAERRLPVVAAALLACAAWGIGVQVTRRPPALVEVDLEPVLSACVEAQERYRSRHGHYAPTLGYLDEIDPTLATGLTQGYVIRYATFDQGKSWGLAADPVPPLPGMRSFQADPQGVRIGRSQYGSLHPPGGWRRPR